MTEARLTLYKFKLYWKTVLVSGRLCWRALRQAHTQVLALPHIQPQRPMPPEAPESQAAPAPEASPDLGEPWEPVLTVPAAPPSGADDVVKYVFPLAPTLLQPIAQGQCQPPEPDSLRWYSTHAWQRVEHALICRRCLRVWP